jgi:hypothetical protein
MICSTHILCTNYNFAVEAPRRVKHPGVVHIERESRLCQLVSGLKTVAMLYSAATPSSTSLLGKMN